MGSKLSVPLSVSFGFMMAFLRLEVSPDKVSGPAGVGARCSVIVEASALSEFSFLRFIFFLRPAWSSIFEY